MYHPTTRVLAVLELLQTHGRMSGPELAQRLAVDVRTLRRYIARLEELGIPVIAERGRYGMYALVAGYKLPPMMFTDNEALALTVGLVAARSMGLAESAPAVESAQAKLERVMPTQLRHSVRALGETISLNLQGASTSGDNHILLSLSTATHAQQRVHLHYLSHVGEASERNIDPYGLVYRDGHWYVIGHCQLRQGLRSFRLDRIRTLDLLAEHFTAPADFDAASYLAQGIASLPRAIAVEVLLKTDLDTARRNLQEGIGLLLPEPAGILLRSQTDDLDWYARQLARLPCDFSIRQPNELADALRRCATRLLALGQA